MPGLVTHVGSHPLSFHGEDFAVTPIFAFFLVRHGQRTKFEFAELFAKRDIFLIREKLTWKKQETVRKKGFFDEIEFSILEFTEPNTGDNGSECFIFNGLDGEIVHLQFGMYRSFQAAFNSSTGSPNARARSSRVASSCGR